MPVSLRPLLAIVSTIILLMVALLGLHLGYPVLRPMAMFSPLFGAFFGGILGLVSINTPLKPEQKTEAWFGQEKLAWTLISCGCIGWGIGECFWRYYVAHGQTPFPSLADLGYSSFAPLVFIGLIIQPLSTNTRNNGNNSKRLFLFLDSLISMGALLSIAWFFLLGSLAQTPSESPLGKFLGLYYAVADVAMISCIIFLILRGSGASQSRVRRTGLIIVGVGIIIFASSDFLFNVLQNLGLPVDGTWVDLGWPIGMLIMGTAAYLRRFRPAQTTEVANQKEEQQVELETFGWAQVVPYLLITILFIVVTINVLSSNAVQQSIRPVLIIATFLVIILVIARQIVTLIDNSTLMRAQVMANHKLEILGEEKAKRNETLEMGINYLKDIQTRLANGDVKARANINDTSIGELYPLARGMNTMADRMMRSERNLKQADQLTVAFDALSQALERSKTGQPFVLPQSCNIPEIHRFLLALGIKPQAWTAPPPSSPNPFAQKTRPSQGTAFFGDM